MKKLEHEVIAVLGVVAAVAEVIAVSLPPSATRDAIQTAIPIIAAIIGRSQVKPA